jgi:hypothetical protein
MANWGTLRLMFRFPKGLIDEEEISSYLMEEFVSFEIDPFLVQAAAEASEPLTASPETCDLFDIPAALERSRSGNGGHIWIFFSEPVPATFARKMGTFLLTQTMDRRPEIGLDSYDRFFPSQDTLPKSGFGNLIALPLQKKPREQGNSLFLDENFIPYPDQWAFLSSIHQMSRQESELFFECHNSHIDNDTIKLCQYVLSIVNIWPNLKLCGCDEGFP